MSSIFRDVFREVLWFLASFVLKITDYIYGIILSFFGLNLGDFGFIWNFYAIVLTVTGLFITFRIGVIIFRSFWDDSTMQKIGGTELINRVLAVGLVLSLVQVIMPMMSELASSSATILPTIISNNAEVVPSDIIIESGMANFSGSLSESVSIDLEEDEHAIDVITIDTINEKNLQGGYKYISNTSNIFLMLILGGFSAYVFVFIAIQIVQRMVGLLMKIAIAPYAFHLDRFCMPFSSPKKELTIKHAVTIAIKIIPVAKVSGTPKSFATLFWIIGIPNTNVVPCPPKIPNITMISISFPIGP